MSDSIKFCIHKNYGVCTLNPLSGELRYCSVGYIGTSGWVSVKMPGNYICSFNKKKLNRIKAGQLNHKFHISPTCFFDFLEAVKNTEPQTKRFYMNGWRDSISKEQLLKFLLEYCV